jgi:hypothetical protein
MEIIEENNIDLRYDEIEEKIKSKKWKLIMVYLMITAYTFLLLFYLMIVHNPTFQLSSLAPIAIGVFIASDLKNKIRKLEGDLEYIVRYNEENKVE